MAKGITQTTTYCNPLSLPDYPRGQRTYDKSRDYGWMFLDAGEKNDFRETADPVVLYHDGKWYLYPSCGMAYVSEDFVTWTHVRIEPYNLSYAPAIAKFRGRFLLTASHEPIYVADNPLGPFHSTGAMLLPNGKPMGSLWGDPALFADDDDQLYAYFGLGKQGICGARLDPEHPNRLLTEPKAMFHYNPAHVWERFGDWNENIEKNCNEGAWMFKHKDVYYLTYAAPGTEWKTYSMGTYVSKRPLGPFAYQKRNPILRDTEGLVHGPGHGSLVYGPKGTLWAFYTCLVRNEHNFERRIGVDPAGFDKDGNLFVRGCSEIPQWAPGLVKHPERGNNAGLLPVSINKRVAVSSEAPGRRGVYAVDNVMRTWWQAADTDQRPVLEVDLQWEYLVSAVRILWGEPGLDYEHGIRPGPVRYKIETCREDKPWRPVVDRTDSMADMLIDYQVFRELTARKVRLRITEIPKGLAASVVSFTVFGRQDHPRYLSISR